MHDGRHYQLQASSSQAAVLTPTLLDRAASELADG
jgi:hypothetical protein